MNANELKANELRIGNFVTDVFYDVLKSHILRLKMFSKNNAHV